MENGKRAQAILLRSLRGNITGFISSVVAPNFSSLQSIEILNDDTTIHFIDYIVQSTFLYPQCSSLLSFLDALLHSNAVICDGIVNNDSTSGKYLIQTFHKSLALPPGNHGIARNFAVVSSFYLTCCRVMVLFLLHCSSTSPASSLSS